MSGLPVWIQFPIVVIAILWLVSLVFLVWVVATSADRRFRVQYLLVRAHFFKGFEMERVNGALMETERIQYMATVKILRTVVSAIAFINFITALVLLLLGIWLLTQDTGIGDLIKVLVLVVAPLLLLLSLYSTILFVLLSGTYRHLVRVEVEAGRHPA